MTQLDLVFSREFGLENPACDRLRQTLALHAPVGEPKMLLRKSGGLQLPALIELVADLHVWALFASAAAAFSVTIGKRAADASWDFVRSRLKQTKAEPIADVAAALANTASTAAKDVQIRLTLRLPGEPFGPALVIEGSDPAAIAVCLSAFVNHGEGILQVMQAATSDGRQPRGEPRVTLADDGGVVVTWRCADGTECRKLIA